MNDMFQSVLEESQRFRAALPDLLERFGGQWVVFHEGAVASAHATEEAAYQSGMATFGRHGVFVVDRVAAQHAIPLTAAVVYA